MKHPGHLKNNTIVMLFTLCFFVSSGVSFANGNSPETGAQTRKAQKVDAKRSAQKALTALRNAYVLKNQDAFFQSASEEPYFSQTDLKVRLSSDFTRYDVLDLNFTVDHELTEGDKVVLKTHWQKRQVRRDTGNVELKEGRSDFVFRVEEAQAHLLDIQKDNPF